MIIGISGKLNSGKDVVADIIMYLQFLKDNPSFEKTLTFEQWQRQKETLPNIWEVKRFADKLKDIVCMLIGCTRTQLEDRNFKEKELDENWWVYELDEPDGMLVPYLGDDSNWLRENNIEPQKLTPRRILQLLGTEAGRGVIHPDIWVNSLISGYETNKSKWLVPDCRFHNEGDVIPRNGGIVIRVNRPLWFRFPELWDTLIGGGAKDCEESFLEKLKECNFEMYNKLTHPSETSLDNYNGFTATLENDGSIEDLIEKVTKVVEPII